MYYSVMEETALRESSHSLVNMGFLIRSCCPSLCDVENISKWGIESIEYLKGAGHEKGGCYFHPALHKKMHGTW